MKLSHNLLFEIVRCKNLAAAGAQPSHPCSEVAKLNEATGQLPEPWNGHIETAPLLFISTNPSFDTAQQYPTREWPDHQVVSFFDGRFDGVWLRKSKPLLITGQYGEDAISFFTALHARAKELFEEDPAPGAHYAMTELVHCKSKREGGVNRARKECAERYLERVVAMSGAKVLVFLGRHARTAAEQRFALPKNTRLSGPAIIEGRERWLSILPHPAAYEPKTFEKCLTSHELDKLRRVLAS